MFNYYNFSKLIDDGYFKYYNSLSNKTLKHILDDSFNNLDHYLIYYANIFKSIFKGDDYDEFYYSCLSLSEDLNNIKIILNILRKRNKR